MCIETCANSSDNFLLMPDHLKILHLEDVLVEAELIHRELKKTGLSFEAKIVQTREEFEDGLKNFFPDLILSDHSMPDFDSVQALRVFKHCKLNIPFILVTGTVSEEFAVTCIQNGADDYILKSNLVRLSPAIESAIARKRAEMEFEKEERLLKAVLNSINVGILACNKEGMVTFLNPAIRQMHDILPELIESGNGLEQNNLYHSDGKMAIQRDEMPLVKILNKGKLHNFEVAFKPEGNNPVRYFLFNGEAILDGAGEVQGAVAAMHEITEAKETERAIVHAIFEGQEQERKRFAEDLHDGLGQLLTSVQLNLSALDNEISGLGPNQKRLFELSNSILGEAIKETRSIAHNLMPRSLESGLIHALQELVGRMETKIKINFNIHGKARKLEQQVEVGLYRIAQELLNNIWKHAKATNIIFDLTYHKNRIRISVEDNGTGFDHELIEKESGIGLANMFSRARMLGGSFHITSRPGRGTCVVVEVSSSV